MPYGRRRRAGRVSIAGTKLTWCGVDSSRHAVDWSLSFDSNFVDVCSVSHGAVE